EPSRFLAPGSGAVCAEAGLCCRDVFWSRPQAARRRSCPGAANLSRAAGGCYTVQVTTTDPPRPEHFRVTRLGASQIPSPLRLSTVRGDAIADYVTEDTRVLACIELSQRAGVDSALAFEKAGPRPQIFFDPSTVHAALLTAGGLCPGINNVIRSIVLELYHRYGVRHISGIRYGYEGLNPETGLPPVELGPDDVKHIHGWGGSELGVGRGAQDVDMM